MDTLNFRGLIRRFMKRMRAAVPFHHPLLEKFIYSTGLKRPDLPHQVGMTAFQEKGAYELNPERCSCDVDFVDYLKQFNIRGKNIFHFGTGAHHIVGLENQAFDRPNEVLGITAANPEHQAYVRLVLKNSALTKYYKVLFADIYTLTANTLPAFDFVTLFHLCEFYLPENAPKVHQTDRSLLQLLIDKLNPDGKILFYTSSFRWSEAKVIVDAFEQAGQIKLIDQYKGLLIYAKTQAVSRN